MTAVGENDSSLAAKCLDLCQTLAVQGLAFNFSLKIGSSYSFSLDARDKGLALNTASDTMKRKSPSTLRRNARRKEAFLQKKQNPAPVTPAPGVEPDVGLPRGEDSFKCDICGNFFKSENGLRIHKGKRHKHQEPPQLEKIRGSNIANSMLVSPLKDVVREEEPNMQVFSCDKCGEEFDAEDNLVTHMQETHDLPIQRIDCVWCHHCKQLFYDGDNYIVNTFTIACPGCSDPWPNRRARLASLIG